MTALVDGINRWRLVIWTGAVGFLLIVALSGFLGVPESVRTLLAGGSYAVLALAAVTVVVSVAATHSEEDLPPLPVFPPVQGRWWAVNTPSSRVPSHGTRLYGQTFAIDLVYDPKDATPRPSGGMVAANRFPSFGQPVLAMADGEVVTVSDWRRDHRSRTSWWALAYFFTVEGIARSIGGPSWVVGNHVVVRDVQGSFALVAHLRRGSACVRVGDRVRAGEIIGECGNSGNSTEPHVHMQLMDRRSLWIAQGRPFSFAGASPVAVEAHEERGGATAEGRFEGVPANGEHVLAQSEGPIA